MLNKYHEDCERIQAEALNNVYNIEDYRKRRAPVLEDEYADDIIKYSLTHNLVWSESKQEYERVPINSALEDED